MTKGDCRGNFNGILTKMSVTKLLTAEQGIQSSRPAQQTSLSAATKTEVIKSDGTLSSGGSLNRVQTLSLFLLHSLLSFEKVHFNNQIICFKLPRTQPKVWIVHINKKEDWHHISC